MFGASEKRPAEHRTETVDPLGQYDPGCDVHDPPPVDVQELEPMSLVVPGKQVMHIDDPASEYVFAGHGPEQFTEGRPVTLPKRPAGHGVASITAPPKQYEPMGQGRGDSSSI